MSSILKSVTIDPQSYFNEKEIGDLISFVKETNYQEFLIKEKIDQVNADIAKMLGMKQ